MQRGTGGVWKRFRSCPFWSECSGNKRVCPGECRVCVCMCVPLCAAGCPSTDSARIRSASLPVKSIRLLCARTAVNATWKAKIELNAPSGAGAAT